MVADKNDKKLQWFVKNLCNIALLKKENGFAASLNQPVVVDKSFDDQFVLELARKVNSIILSYIVEQQEKGNEEIDSQQLYEYVMEKL